MIISTIIYLIGHVLTAAKWVAACNVPSDTCKNQGYLGKDCNCVCPEGTSGSVCGTKEKEYTGE